jgi:hypothetical protein
MKHKQIILFIVFLSGLRLMAAATPDSLLRQVPAKATFFTTDQLSNIYYINEQYEIVKYIWTEERTFTYSNKQLGKPGWIDASNPMQVLVLYPDVQTVVILDSRMGQVNLIRLLATADGHSYLPLAACAQPEDDFFWIFDGLQQKLVKLDERGMTVAESEAFTSMFDFSVLEPRLYYQGQTLFLSDPVPGILIFDRFGSFVRGMELGGDGMLQIERDHFLFLADDSLHLVNRQLYGSEVQPLPLTGVLQIRLVSGRLFLRTPNGISVFRNED